MEQAVTNPSDAYPPSRIVDLNIVSHEPVNKTIIVKFTAPGDDLDFGQGKFEYKPNHKYRLLIILNYAHSRKI